MTETPKSILLLYISVGQGHRKAALPIQDALKEADPLLKVVCLDLLEIWPRWVGGLVTGLYRTLVRVAPRLWASVYDHRRVKERLSRPLQLLRNDNLRQRMVESIGKIRKPDAARQAAQYIIWGIGNGHSPHFARATKLNYELRPRLKLRGGEITRIRLDRRK